MKSTEYRGSEPVIFSCEAPAPAEKEACFALRRAVFVDEQGFAAEIEHDAADADPVTRHFFAADENGEILTACRIRPTEKGWKLERVATAAAARGRGIGSQLMREVMKTGLPMFCHAQLSARTFYERLGWQVEGELFTEAGHEHIRMAYSPKSS